MLAKSTTNYNDDNNHEMIVFYICHSWINTHRHTIKQAKRQANRKTQENTQTSRQTY